MKSEKVNNATNLMVLIMGNLISTHLVKVLKLSRDLLVKREIIVFLIRAFMC